MNKTRFCGPIDRTDWAGQQMLLIPRPDLDNLLWDIPSRHNLADVLHRVNIREAGEAPAALRSELTRTAVQAETYATC